MQTFKWFFKKICLLVYHADFYEIFKGVFSCKEKIFLDIQIFLMVCKFFDKTIKK